MKNILLKSIFLSITFLLCLSSIKSQNINHQDSFISISKIRTYLLSADPPLYIIDIRNNQTISFYNILTESFTKIPSNLNSSWIIDSTTVNLENTDFTKLMETINRIDLKTIAKVEKPKSKNGIERMISGGAADKYIIELSNQKVAFFIGSNNRNYISESAKIIRDLFKELEDKYKPKE